MYIQVLQNFDRLSPSANFLQTSRLIWNFEKKSSDWTRNLYMKTWYCQLIYFWRKWWSLSGIRQVKSPLKVVSPAIPSLYWLYTTHVNWHRQGWSNYLLCLITVNSVLQVIGLKAGQCRPPLFIIRHTHKLASTWLEYTARTSTY